MVDTSMRSVAARFEPFGVIWLIFCVKFITILKLVWFLFKWYGAICPVVYGKSCGHYPPRSVV